MQQITDFSDILYKDKHSADDYLTMLEFLSTFSGLRDKLEGLNITNPVAMKQVSLLCSDLDSAIQKHGAQSLQF